MKARKKRSPRAGGTAAGAGQSTSSPHDSAAARLPRAARRALTDYDRKGCWHCGERPSLLAVGPVGKTWRAVCAEHEGILDKVCGYSTPITELVDKKHMNRLAQANGLGDIVERGGLRFSAPDADFSADDRRWFAAHPGRAHRMREPYRKEWDGLPVDAAPGHRLVTIVRQFEPGARMRLPYMLPEGLDPSTATEHMAHAFFAAVARAYRLGRQLTAAEFAECFAETAPAGGVQ